MTNEKTSKRCNGVALVPTGATQWPPEWLRPKPKAETTPPPEPREPEYLPTSFDAAIIRLAEPIDGSAVVVLSIRGRPYKAVTLSDYIEGMK